MKKYLYPAMSALGLLGIIGLVIASNASRMDEDEWIIAQVYHYRTLATRYDSCVVRCTYGEICVPDYIGSDSLRIEWNQTFMEPGLDSTADVINSMMESRPFLLTDSTTLSMLHMITLLTEDDNAPYSIPDTTAWTMELWSSGSRTRIATIDSIGICKATAIQSTEFPSTFGFTGFDAFEIVTIDLGSYATQGVDSVYLVLRMRNWDSNADPFCTVYDNDTYNAKYSHMLGLGKRSGHTLDATTPDKCELSVFPNPAAGGNISLRLSVRTEQFITVTMFSSEGRSVATFFSGVSMPGTVRVFPLRLPSYPTGVYYIRASGEDGSTLSTQKIVISK